MSPAKKAKSPEFTGTAYEGAESAMDWRDSRHITFKVDENDGTLYARWFVVHGASGVTEHKIAIPPSQLLNIIDAVGAIHVATLNKQESA